MATLSSDLIWEVTRPTSAFLVKRKQAGGVSFSRDPLNLKGKFSRKYEGLVADKAIGVQAGENGGVTLLTKKADKSHQPASAIQSATFPASRSTRKTYANIVNATTKRNYRPDLRADAVARASAIRKSQKAVKADKPKKARGNKAQA
ncbi:ribosomal protein L28e [Aaosphaeria arxii CBS 175.79]|uniref:Ribosomal protein L28e n=1 Tax=Aaosphaeria arxii CBS 175.79 TaxID=1450172 RepID=A0A6A5XIA8_9PLEO|nr:ribosomal protein L28e [Aaosphaeria arxii CBS 175.79]KAF2012609.1 ribosomal protein L28e [Aaosphaeria arxii CBS 175.79]